MGDVKGVRVGYLDVNNGDDTFTNLSGAELICLDGARSNLQGQIDSLVVATGVLTTLAQHSPCDQLTGGGTLLLLTASAACIITQVIVRATDGCVTPPTARIDATGGTVFVETELTGLTVAGKSWIWTASGLVTSIALGETLSLICTVPASGGSPSFAVEVLGYYV